MVHLQGVFTHAPPLPLPDTNAYFNLIQRWWDACPYFSLPDEIKALYERGKYLQEKAIAIKNSITVTEKDISFTDMESSTQKFFHRIWSVEIHYFTPDNTAKPKGNLPRCYLKLSRRKETVIQPIVYEPERFEEVMRFLLGKGIRIKEFRNGRRALFGNPPDKKNLREYRKRYTVAF